MKKIVKVFCYLYFFMGCMLLFGRNGQAYIDPSVVTYLIQAIAGIVIAVGAFFGIYWRRLKKKLKQIFKIELTHYKEIEPDEIIYKECSLDKES